MPSLSQPITSSEIPDEAELDAALARLMEGLRTAEVPDAIRLLAQELQSALEKRAKAGPLTAERQAD